MSPTIDREGLLLASLCKQHLLTNTSSHAVMSTLCGLQAQFANYPKHALRIRASDYDEERWNHGLVKVWTFRGTLHLVNRDELGLYLSAIGVPKKWGDDWGIGARSKPRLSKLLMSWIREGVHEREALKHRCRKHGIGEETVGCIFHGWGGLMKEMCKRGLVAYAPGTEKRFLPCGEVDFMARDAARLVLAERYFRYLGPGTLEDFITFSGYGKREAETILAGGGLPLRSVVCGEDEYFYLDDWDTKKNIPSCLFLAGFDQMLLAYKNRERLMDAGDKAKVVTTSGIIHPTVLLDGRLRARWKIEKGELRVYPFKRLSAAAKKTIRQGAERTFGKGIAGVVIA